MRCCFYQFLQAYTKYVCDLARHYRRSPELISYEEVTRWLYHLIKGRQLSASSVNRRVEAYCKKYGKFRPKFHGSVQRLGQAFELIANENAVHILPAFVVRQPLFPAQLRHSTLGGGRGDSPTLRSGLSIGSVLMPNVPFWLVNWSPPDIPDCCCCCW